MEPLRKHFENGDRFPFRLVYQDTKSPQHELPDHLHDGFELIYVYAGKGVLFVNHAFYDMCPGDLFLIPGNTIHRAFPDTITPVTSTAIFFGRSLIRPTDLGEAYSPLRCFDYAKKRRRYKLETAGPDREAIVRLIEAMQEELLGRQTGYRHSIMLRLHDLLLTLNRMSVSDAGENGGDAGLEPTWMRETLAFIDENVAAPELKLSGLSRRASITPSHFSRVFKQLTGMTVTDYVAAKRIMAAKELLTLTDENISSICGRCGFESESYFYKTFKSLTGMTPSVYKRRQHADNPRQGK
ncbi:AraC family transcriptional regulator [Cohnella sp. REN36]|uniref:AraC family transcriptional regulator n=1 Tax=Cohnella sp. REN36 TaxID=2887347 RepID=UPI001D13E32E|nr:AraC family transcriptional regulator [Cohnella sp. REN36]MCC3372008.1 AraC family transcriptional regulator [Cohnella sp. REN36]